MMTATIPPITNNTMITIKIILGFFLTASSFLLPPKIYNIPFSISVFCASSNSPVILFDSVFILLITVFFFD